MQTQFKKLVLLAALVPTFAMAQALQQDAPAAPAAGPIDADKKAAIQDLLAAIDAPKLVTAIAHSAENQSKQLVPAILSDALSENKTMTDAQKQAAVPGLQQNAVPKLVDGAGKVFESQQFKSDAIKAQVDAYARYYSTAEIRGLTAFYKSPVGQKFIQVQDQVGHDVVGSLMQQYMPQAIKATRDQADREVAAAATAK